MRINSNLRRVGGILGAGLLTIGVIKAGSHLHQKYIQNNVSNSGVFNPQKLEFITEGSVAIRRVARQYSGFKTREEQERFLREQGFEINLGRPTSSTYGERLCFIVAGNNVRVYSASEIPEEARIVDNPGWAFAENRPNCPSWYNHLASFSASEL